MAIGRLDGNNAWIDRDRREDSGLGDQPIPIRERNATPIQLAAGG
jgi:hypothetical protein